MVLIIHLDFLEAVTWIMMMERLICSNELPFLLTLIGYSFRGELPCMINHARLTLAKIPVANVTRIQTPTRF